MGRVVEPLLGTRAEVHCIAEPDSSDVCDIIERAAIHEVRRLEAIFTVFEPSSALNQMRATGKTTVPELAAVVDLAALWIERSGGAFDPTVERLMQLWDQAEVRGVAPTTAAINAARAQRSSPTNNLNAIAKGWIAQAAVEHVLAEVAESTGLWLSLGGDVVHRGAGSVTVGIEDPHRPYDNVAPMATVVLENAAIATSGGSRRWWTIDGVRYPKVLDPRSGLPTEVLAGATVWAADAATADVLATIALIADVDQTLALVADAGAECLLVHHDRTHTCTSDRFATATPPR